MTKLDLDRAVALQKELNDVLDTYSHEIYGVSQDSIYVASEVFLKFITEYTKELLEEDGNILKWTRYTGYYDGVCMKCIVIGDKR